MTKLTMPNILFLGISNIVAIDKIIGAVRAEQVATKSAMMPSSNK